MNRSRAIGPVPVMLAAVVALSSGLLDGRPAAASTSAAADCPSTAQSRGSVLVTGTGVVYGEPDTLIANFAAETTAATVGEALESANTAATRMRDTLVGGGVARADLQTSNVNISAKQNDKGQITGYTVNQGLTAKIRKLAGAGALMSATVAAGGDAARLNGVSFTIENDAALLAEARRKAFADARGKAALYAGQAGRPLGRVIRVSEVPLSCGYFDNQDRMAAAYSPVPIEPGRQQLAVTVTVEWALGSLPPSSLG